MERGILDLLDKVDELIGQLDYSGPLDQKTARQNRIKAQNARMAIQEVRRRIERAGHETKT